MSLQGESNGDSIDVLPVDQSIPTSDEVQIMKKFFTEKSSTLKNILTNLKDVLLIGLLFILFSLPQLSPLIVRFIPSAKSEYILILIKAAFFMLVYFIVKNWYLAKKY